MWLDKGLKAPFQRTFWQATWEGGLETVEIWATPPFLYFLITVEAINLDKISLSDMQSLKNVY